MPTSSESSNNPKRKKNVAVIGAGWFGNAHCRVTSQVANLKAICDTNADRVKATAAKYNIQHYTDYNKLFDFCLSSKLQQR